jgi:hypothetical protein
MPPLTRVLLLDIHHTRFFHTFAALSTCGSTATLGTCVAESWLHGLAKQAARYTIVLVEAAGLSLQCISSGAAGYKEKPISRQHLQCLLLLHTPRGHYGKAQASMLLQNSLGAEPGIWHLSSDNIADSCHMSHVQLQLQQ